ncbi:MAG: SpoIIE family protein phosphatase [Spirochaetales bacterium]|nr:SpoIIE family protein phosphatase [Spirochaetales bacterium]
MKTHDINIILVEDNPGDARLIKEALSESEKIGATIEHVVRMSELIDRFKERTFDLIILDLTLPDATGLETVRRTNSLAPETPIVVLSGLTDEELAIKAVQEGAQDYLVKGQADSRVLERVILYALERNQARIRIGALRDELQRALLEIDEELEISANIQRRIIQQNIPDKWAKRTSVYYAFAKKIGGDLFDIIPINDLTTAFVIADGSGHNVHAAFLSIMFKLSLRHQVFSSKGPAELIEGINTELQPYFLENMFFTSFAAWVDEQSNRLVYSTAGHPAQYLLSPKRDKIFRLKNDGIPLCINLNTEYEVSSVSIEKGDKLVLFTDGIYAWLDDCGERFCEQSLVGILREHMALKPEALKQKIIKNKESVEGEIIGDYSDCIDDAILIVAEL